MDKQELRTLQILEEVDKDHIPSQRELAQKLNISLGLVNSFLKRLSNKGFFKLANIPKKRIKYILTPKGIAEKTRLTYKYIQFSYHFYKDARMRLQKLFQDFIKNNDQYIIFFGVGDFAEIAYLSLQEASIELVAIVDEEMAGNKFFNMVIEKPDTIASKTFDKLLITADNSSEAILNELKNNGIPRDKIAVML
ncbi:MAG: winged helix-turn-helix transcriptional regulator [Deltaproteobacteria bacterium]|nr:winged helix-turn-helix transcriptional regulator [Deltaproteobacteria bacterium]MBW2219823.1 winged helix-turn-helix transcriptional regulator [Deltaproteobacteria bacterium]